MAERQTAQEIVRNLFLLGQTVPAPCRGGGGIGGGSIRIPPLLRELNFWKVLLAQYQSETASEFSMLNSPRSQTTRPAPTERPHQRRLPARRRRLNEKAIERGASFGAGNRSAPVRRERTEAN
jgi:hypothetical protein